MRIGARIAGPRANRAPLEDPGGLREARRTVSRIVPVQNETHFVQGLREPGRRSARPFRPIPRHIPPPGPWGRYDLPEPGAHGDRLRFARRPEGRLRMAGRFGSVITAMATPFRDDFSLDLGRAQELASWLLDHGSDGLVVFGSTGEAATQSDAEKRDLLRAVKEASAGRGSIIAGTGTYDTAHSIHLTHMAEENGADAVLTVTPYYNRPPQRGLIAHFTKIAGSTELPVILYNIPSRTSCVIEGDT